MLVVLISGGSGGHLMPAVALADRLRPDARCLFVSTRRLVDQTLSESSRDPWTTVDLAPFTPLWRWFSPAYWARQWRAVGQVRSVFRDHHPDVVVGFGGYLSAVGVFMARTSGIRSVIHEQNVVPGKANRLLARMADAVAVSFPDTQRYLPGARVEVTGNPIRFNGQGMDRAAACAAFGLDPARPVVLIMGGSQGSQAVNTLALGMWEQAPENRRRAAQALHIAGPLEAERVEAAYRRLGMEARVFPFLREMHAAFSAATLAVSRAGATGIAEMVALRVPAVLIPYPHAGAHQSANARWMERAGGAAVFEETGLSPDRLWREISSWLEDPARLERMRNALGAHAAGRADERLGTLVRGIAKMRPVRAELVEARTSDAQRVHPSTGSG